MSVATIMTVLGIVNALLTVAKETPGVVDEARSLLAKVEPHIQDAGVGVATWFEALKEQAGAA